MEPERGSQPFRLFGIGNALVDYIVHINPNEDIHKRYKIKIEDAIVASPEHMSLYEEVESRSDVEIHTGGSALNTLRMVQWILGADIYCTFVGCIDKDNAGGSILEECRRLHLNAKLQLTDKGSGTGKCAVLVSGIYRSMIAHLGACQDLELKHIESESVWRHAERATLFYSTAFIINTCYDGLLKLARYAAEKHKPFLFNLGAPYMSTHYIEQIDSILPFVSIIFGNAEEARTYADTNGFDVDSCTPESVVQFLADKLVRSRTSHPCLAIITDGKDPITVAKPQHPSDIRSFPVPEIPDDEIADTDGAGDSFVAGFITQYVRSPKNIDSAIQAAIKAASYIIRQVGSSLGPRNLYH